MRAQRSRGIALVILASAVWSTTGILVRLIFAEVSISPVGLAFWRDLSAFICLLVVIVIFRPQLLRVNLRDLPWMVAMGVLSVGLFHVLWNLTVLINGVALATVIQYSAPVFVAILGWAFLGERLTARKIGAILLAFGGIALLSLSSGLDGAQVTLIGLLVGLMGAIALSTYSLFGKKLAGDNSTWTILLYAFGFGTLALLPFQLGTAVPGFIPLSVLGYFAALVLLGTIAGFGLYTMALHHLQASVAAIMATSEVLFAAVLAYIILGERLGIWQVLGAILVVSGVVLVSLSSNYSISVSTILRRLKIKACQ